MTWLLGQIWRHRSTVVLAIQVLAALRKTAQELTREYIRRRVAEKLRRQITVVSVEVALLAAALVLNRVHPSLLSSLFASTVLWSITLYNLGDLLLFTLPEIFAVHRFLKGKTGYAMKQLLQISVATELMQLNTFFLAFCLMAGISSRTFIGMKFSYVRPWSQALALSAEKHGQKQMRGGTHRGTKRY